MGDIHEFPQQSNHGGQSPDSSDGLDTYGVKPGETLTPRGIRSLMRKMGIKSEKPRRPKSLARERNKRRPQSRGN